jgi:hypothetical protein
LRTPWPAKPTGKNAAKSESDELTSMEKYTQLLFIERIFLAQNINKPSYYHNVLWHRSRESLFIFLFELCVHLFKRLDSRF